MSWWWALAHKVAERVRLAVESLAIPHTGGSRGIVTVSIGLAAAVATPQTGPLELVDQADAHLYQAKREGRDRVSSGVTGPAAANR